MPSISATEVHDRRNPSWIATAIHIALVLANGTPLVLVYGWFAMPNIDFGLTCLLFAWFWAMFSAIAGIANHFRLAQPCGWFSFVVAPIISAFWLVFALARLHLL